MEKVLVSGCLLGHRVRYDGNALSLHSGILDRWRAEGRIVSVCPEVEGGLGIPRPPAEIVGGDGDAVWRGEAEVVTKRGDTVSEHFRAGASAALALCRRHHIKVAVLVESSPSCGSSTIYDGSFSRVKVSGSGVTAALLRQDGVQVFSQHDVSDADQALRALFTR